MDRYEWREIVGYRVLLRESFYSSNITEAYVDEVSKKYVKIRYASTNATRWVEFNAYELVEILNNPEKDRVEARIKQLLNFSSW